MVGVSSGASQQSDHLKSSEKNRGPFVPFVISFSDDDTGSDSDDSRHNTLVTTDNKQRVDRSRTPPVSSLQMSQKLIQNTTKKTNDHREVSLSRPYVLSVTKINGATPSNSGQKYSSGNFSTFQKEVGQDLGPLRKSNVHLSTNKQQLQDLRQLIAIRESQLKLKSTQQTKNSVAGSCRDGKSRNPSNSGNRACKASRFDLRSELNEPEKKRLKTGESQSSQLDLDKNLHSLQQILTTGKSRLNNCGKESVDDHGHCGQKTFPGTSLLSLAGVQKQAETRDSLLSADPPNVANEGKCLNFFFSALLWEEGEEGKI